MCFWIVNPFYIFSHKNKKRQAFGPFLTYMKNAIQTLLTAQGEKSLKCVSDCQDTGGDVYFIVFIRVTLLVAHVIQSFKCVCFERVSLF